MQPVDRILAFKQVKTVEGIAELQIPPGTQPGDTLVLSKKGAPKLNRPSIRGDHLFTVKVSIPNRIRYSTIFPFLSNFIFARFREECCDEGKGIRTWHSALYNTNWITVKKTID